MLYEVITCTILPCIGNPPVGYSCIIRSNRPKYVRGCVSYAEADPESIVLYALYKSTVYAADSVMVILKLSSPVVEGLRKGNQSASGLRVRFPPVLLR